MQDQRERERAKIDGRAAFAAAAYLMGVGLIFLLGRVGAPDGLVQGLGPLFALAAVALLGVLTRSTRVPTFFIADRAVPAPYGDSLSQLSPPACFYASVRRPGRRCLWLAWRSALASAH